MPKQQQFGMHLLIMVLVTTLAACGGGPTPAIRQLPSEAIAQFDSRDWQALQATLAEAETQLPNDTTVLLLQAISDFCHGRFPDSLRSLDTIHALGDDAEIPSATFRTGSVLQETAVLTPIVEARYASPTPPAIHGDTADFYCANLATYEQAAPTTPATTTATTVDETATAGEPTMAAAQELSPGEPAFRISLVRFANEDNAHRLFQTLNQAGLPDSLAAKLQLGQIRDVRGAPRYLIFLGDYRSLDELRASEDTIRQSALPAIFDEYRVGDSYCLEHREPGTTDYTIMECPPL